MEITIGTKNISNTWGTVLGCLLAFLSVEHSCIAAQDTSADEGIHWIAAGGTAVSETNGFENGQLFDDHWEGVTVIPVESKLTFSSLDIDANRAKYLYFKIATTRKLTLRVSCSADSTGQFFDAHWLESRALAANPEPVIYRLNLSSISFWKGSVNGLRIYLRDFKERVTVRVFGLGISSEPIDPDGKNSVIALPVSAAPQLLPHMACWHHTLVYTNGLLPTFHLSTYVNDFARARLPLHCSWYMLARLVPGVEVDGRMIWADAAKQVEVLDVPGGVVSSFMLGSVQVSCELFPLKIGRRTEAWDGAALYRITTNPQVPVVLKCGGGAAEYLGKSPVRTWELSTEAGFTGAQVETAEDGVAFLTSSEHPFTVSIRSSGAFEKKANEKGAEYSTIRFEQGQGHLVMAFAKDRKQLLKLAELNPTENRKEIDAYYDALLSNCWINTPETKMNEAFRTAVITLEYCWCDPLGWIESPHHWPALWHMQHIPAALWIGQADRAKKCLLEHGRRIFPDGELPCLSSDGTARRCHWTNDYFWEAQNYWDHTEDQETIKTLAPILDKALRWTYSAYDSDRNLLLAWGHQIGNQEDHLKHPFDSSTPTIEGINMMRTRTTLAKALGDEQTAQSLEWRLRGARANLRSHLWMKDLGRFMYFLDPEGQQRLDGQYETLIYPLIDNIVNPLDSWTSMRHLRDRLTGQAGEVYCSNNFAEHSPTTIGTAAAVAQPPWGAWGLSAMGLRNETYRPLKIVSEWVMSDLNRGVWPEITEERAYFSPSAGLFIQATIEALFGLQIHKPQDTLSVAPSFPDQWPSAKLHLPDFSAEYSRKANTLRYRVKSKDPLIRHLRWLLPVGQVKQVRVDGKKADFEITPGVGCIVLEATTPASRDTTFEVEIEPLDLTLDYPASIAEGQPFELRLQSPLVIEKIDDRCGVLSQTQLVGDSELRATIQNDLLKPYLKFGKLGQMNFSRRSFFLFCRPDKAAPFWLPVDLLILPRYEAEQVAQVRSSETGALVRLRVRNNCFASLRGTAYLAALGTSFPFEVDVPPRSEKEYSIVLPDSRLNLLSPGDNQATLCLPGNHSLELVLIASKLFKEKPKLARSLRGRMVPIKLPDEATKAEGDWHEVRNFYELVCPSGLLQAFDKEQTQVEVPDLPGLSFNIDGQRLVPISAKTGRPSFTLPLGSQSYKKIYLLVIPLLDNQDMFARVARISLQIDETIMADADNHIGKGIIVRTLRFPGDLDRWHPVGSHPWTVTFRERSQQDRYGLLPLLDTTKGDWKLAKPPAFPQPEYWSRSLAVSTPTMIMNVVEIDLGEARTLKSLTVSTLGRDPAVGLLAVTAEKGHIK